LGGGIDPGKSYNEWNNGRCIVSNFPIKYSLFHIPFGGM
jgi:hypothetical protein